MRFFIFALSMLAFLAVGAADALAQQARPIGQEPLIKVVASFSVLGDMIRQVGGDAVQVAVLAGPETDLHAYEAQPQDVRAIAQADVIAINGLGLDQWMQPLIEASGTHAKLLVASAGVKPRYVQKRELSIVDPHAWQDVMNGRLYIRNIAGALIAAAPEQGAYIRENARRYDEELKQADVWIRRQISAVPAAKRKIITSHDAFGYFGRAYGVTFFDPVGLNTQAEVSPAQVAALVEQMKDQGMRTVFLETKADPRLMEQIAQEAEAKVGGELFTDSLSKAGGAAPSYLDMFRHNVPLLCAAMLENTGGQNPSP